MLLFFMLIKDLREQFTAEQGYTVKPGRQFRFKDTADPYIKLDIISVDENCNMIAMDPKDGQVSTITFVHKL